MLRKLLRNKKGQGLVEYSLLVVGIAIVGIAAVSLLGHKTSDLMGLAAVILPGAHLDDSAPIASGHLIETDDKGGTGGNAVEVSTTQIATENGTSRLASNLYGPNMANSCGVNGLIEETD
jgi:pilus assembly protein Flp/PilA